MSEKTRKAKEIPSPDEEPNWKSLWDRFYEEGGILSDTTHIGLHGERYREEDGRLIKLDNPMERRDDE